MCRDFALSRLALMLGLAIPISPIGMLPKGAIAVQPAMAPNAVAQTADRQKAEADRLYSQGVELQDQRQHQAALEKLQQALAIYQKTGDRAAAGRTLRKIGNFYLDTNQLAKALDLYQQALAIAKEVRERNDEANALMNLGIVYGSLSQFDQAIAHYQQALPIFQQVKDRNGEAKVLMNLGIVYGSLSQFDQAIAHYQQALLIFQQVKDRNGEAKALGSLGLAYGSLSKYDKAIAYFEQALAIFRTTPNPKDEGWLLNGLGLAYRSLLQYEKAIPYYERAVTLFRQVQDRNGIASALNELGITYHALYQHEKAISHYQQALPIFQQLKDRNGEANTLMNLGNVYQSLSQYEKAITYYQQALLIFQQIKNSNGEASVLGQLGNVYQLLSQYEKAITYYQQALLISQQIEDRNGEASTLSNLGIAYDSLSQYEKAIAYYQQALPIFQQVKNRIGEANALHNLGNAYQALSQYEKAITYYQQALPVYQQIKDRHYEANTLGMLGNAYQSLSQYEQAITYYQQALPIFQQIKDRNGEADTLGMLGSIYQLLSQYEQAIAYYLRILPVYRQIKDRNGEASTLNRLGIAYDSLSQYEQAITYYQQALPLFQQIKDRNGEANTLNNLGIAYKSFLQYEQAIAYYQQALPIYQQIKDHNGGANTLANLGEAYQSLLQYEKAIAYYQQALPIFQWAKDRSGEGQLLSDIGDLLVQQKQTELAIVFYKQSVNVRETIRQDIRKLDRRLQESYTHSVAKTYRALADLLLSQGRVLEAQQVLELLKIQELRDYTRDTRTGGTTDGSPLNPLEKPIPMAFNDKIALGSQLTQCEQTKCAQRSQLIAQREAANDKFTALVDRLKKALREQEIKDPAQLQSDRFTLAAQKVILANPKVKTVLVYPLVLDDKLWLVWGSQAGKSAVVFDSKEIPVSRKVLSAKVGELQDLLSQRGNPQKLQQVSQQLYQWLIGPIRKQLDDHGVKQIVFSLDRATRYLPMAVLHDGQQFLIENFAISTILTAEIDTQDKLSANLQDDPVLGLGLTQAISGFPALAAVEAEIDGIVRQRDRPQDTNGIYPGIELFDRSFTEATLREKVADYRILHIATHGKFVPGNPEDSFLVLGDGQELRIPTIKSMASLANTHLVVLSACETAKGGIDKEGLEVAGIGHYFLLSGAKSVMASLWLVNDPATSVLMREFYSRLARGNLSKAEALRQVQIEFLKGKLIPPTPPSTSRDADITVAGIRVAPKNVDFSHPYYWAPFILIGNSL